MTRAWNIWDWDSLTVWVMEWQASGRYSALFWKIKVQMRNGAEQNCRHFKMLVAWCWAVTPFPGERWAWKVSWDWAGGTVLRECWVAGRTLAWVWHWQDVFTSAKFTDLSGLPFVYLWCTTLKMLVVFKYLFRQKPYMNSNMWNI